MSDEWIKILITMSIPTIVAYVGWTVGSIISLRAKISDLREHVTNNHPNNKDMDEVKAKLDRVFEACLRMEGRSMATHESGS